MKTRIFFFLLITIPYQSIACSCNSFNSIFCGSVYDGHYIVHAVVRDSINDYTMSVYILENIYKEIVEDTIYIIGHDGGNCGQDLNVFEEGDTAIFALSIYEDYGIRNWYLNGQCDLSYLRIKNGLINGRIMSDTVVNQTLEEFKDDIFNCIDLRVNIQNIPAHENIEIFPNPATNIINIRTDHQSLLRVELIDTSGKIVTSERPPNLNFHQVGLDNLEQGIYVLKIVSSVGTVSKKIVKH